MEINCDFQHGQFKLDGWINMIITFTFEVVLSVLELHHVPFCIYL